MKAGVFPHEMVPYGPETMGKKVVPSPEPLAIQNELKQIFERMTAMARAGSGGRLRLRGRPIKKKVLLVNLPEGFAQRLSLETTITVSPSLKARIIKNGLNAVYNFSSWSDACF